MKALFRRLLGGSLVLVMLLTASLAGCGFKDRPVPPQQVLPTAIQDLQVEADEHGAVLTWTYPAKTVRGHKLEEISSFKLFRADVRAESYCPTCPTPYDDPISVPGGGLPPDGHRTATYRLSDLQPGHLYFFKVRSSGGWWIESQDSNEVSLTWQAPPAPPQGVSVTAGDGRNVVQWQEAIPSGAAKATVPIRYQLYRGVDGGALSKLGEPVSGHTFTDTAVENGREYAYQVQAIAAGDHSKIKSGVSSIVQARPVDLTPPPVPTSVEGLQTSVGVKLFWPQVQAADLAGYRVYRRTSAMAQPVLVGTVLLPSNLYTDATAPKATLFYSVTSFDTQSTANESNRSAEVRIDN